MTNHFAAWQEHFSRNQKYLLALAFRMTGSLSESEDLVQECFLECAAVDPATIESHRAWLTRVCSNKALDHLKRAYKKREVYSGPWLPDAVPDSFQLWDEPLESISPERKLLASDSLTVSFLLLIEKLSPEERVVYLLAEIFDYPFREIAGFLGKSEDACRKLAERARKAVVTGRPKFTAAPGQAERVITEFFALAKAGNREGLAAMLTAGSQFWSDGGGKVSAAREVLVDAEKIAQFFKGLGLAFFRHAEQFRMEFGYVNQRPGMFISRRLESGEWAFDTIMSFELEGDRIARIYAQRNPDKLAALTG
jgi:RNA polymerase sigma-70 factor (ECF subfamily)